MTILTKQARLDTIESVVKGTFIPAEKAAILELTSKAVYAALKACLPEGFLAATENLPKHWFAHRSGCGINQQFSPCWILAGSEGHGGYTENVPHAELRFPYLYARDTIKWGEVLAAQITAATKLRAKEDALRAELSAFLASCTTYAAVIKGMPDLERHLPAPPAKVYPIVASTKGLQAQLARLGFDRTAAAA